LQAARETIRTPLLEKGAAILEALRAMEQALQEGLREGLERQVLLGTLKVVRPQTERGVEWLRKALAIFEDDTAGVAAIEAQLRTAEGFLAVVRNLEARAGQLLLPFDESKLSLAPDGLTAVGYLSVTEAQARVGKHS
jgi:hypothetical protein